MTVAYNIYTVPITKFVKLSVKNEGVLVRNVRNLKNHHTLSTWT